MITAVHPAARAAPSFRVIIADGKFHGVRMPLVAAMSEHKRYERKGNVHDSNGLFDNNVACPREGRWNLLCEVDNQRSNQCGDRLK